MWKLAAGGLGLAAISLAVGAHAQTPSRADIDASLFGARQSARGMDLSPDGNSVAYIAPARGSGSVAFTADIKTGEAKPFLNSGDGPEKLSWCAFVTNVRLICRYGATLNEGGVLVGYSRLIAVDRDGSDLTQLGQSSSFYDDGYRQSDGRIIDWLPGEGGSVLMAREYVPEISRTGTRLSRRKEGVGVDRLNTITLELSSVESARREVGGYLTDGRGNVRLMAIVELDGEQLTGRTKYFYRTAATREWKDLTGHVTGDDFRPLAIDATVDALYALKPHQGRFALFRIKLGNSPTTELVASNPRVDIDEVIRSGNGQRVIGYSYAEDRREVVYFDPEYDALHDSLARAIPKLPLIQFKGTSVDGNRILIFAGSDSDAGRYFVFDKKTKNLGELMLVRPELENRTLASVKPVAVKSPDGVTIPAYLTLPPGKAAKNLPAVVLPHGGPSSRDEWGFDWLAQYLAARGYAVLQPNYRGSAGFGDDWLVENGFKSWRISIGDITASARWMVSEGIADPDRLAVVGWSYGGYAALQAAATDPSLFKAVAAIAPVTDLPLLKEEAEDYTNADLVAEFVGSGPHLTRGSPLRNADAIDVPVLLVHGDMDTNVGVAHSAKMEAALRSEGTPVEFLRYKSLGHQLDDSAARTEILRKVGVLLERTIGR